MAYLVLEDGAIFEGTSFGSPVEAAGEVVFNTGMTGYEDVLTDPSCYGQLVCMSYPLIGNYGIGYGERRPKAYVKGLIVRELCSSPSNWTARESLEDFLKEQGVCGIYGIDTRALVRRIREKGTLRGMIIGEKPVEAQVEALKSFNISCPVKDVSTTNIYTIPGKGVYKVALIDFGVKHNILDSLSKRGFDITVYPHETPAEKILSDGCDGIVLSNGPGDPKDNPAAVERIKKLIGRRPILGICLGHLLLALAHGGDTYKLKHGHRGSNYPVKHLASGRVYITSQNHGYVADADSLAGKAEVTHVNWNDLSCEGVRYYGSPTVGVQFIPETPEDTAYIYDEFAKQIKRDGI